MFGTRGQRGRGETVMKGEGKGHDRVEIGYREGKGEHGEGQLVWS